VTDPNEAAAEVNDADNPVQAAAASSIGADPGPAKMFAEIISGGDTK
jgi:hypothetical protein